MVAPEAVRQSHLYLVEVRLHFDDVGDDDDGAWEPSFVHEAIPRIGRGKIYSPWDPPGAETFVGDWGSDKNEKKKHKSRVVEDGDEGDG